MTDGPGSTLDALYDAGRRAFPDVDLPRDRFAAMLGERGVDPAAVDAARAADLYLATACSAGNARAVAAFEARYVAQVPRFLAGVEHASAAAEEVRQLVRERLFVAEPGKRPKIAEYSGRGSLESWLRVLTLRVASNQRRRERPHAPLEALGPAELLPGVDPEIAVLRTRYRGAFEAALRAAFAALTPRERLLFRMHFLDGLNIDRIGLVFNVHRATVARWLAAAREGLLDRTLARLRAELNLDPREVASLVAAMRSALDVSLQALLGEAPAADER